MYDTFMSPDQYGAASTHELTAERRRRFELWRQIRARGTLSEPETRVLAGHADAIEALDRILDAREYNGRVQAAFSGGGGEATELRSWLRGESGRAFDVPVGAELRALSAGTAAAGGYSVPLGFAGQVVTHLVNTTPMFTTSTILNTADGAPLVIPATTGYSTASIIAEGAAITASDPTFNGITLNAHKYAVLVQVTRELLEDSASNVEELVARDVGTAIGVAAGGHFATGSGTGQPKGITLSTTLGKTAASPTAITSDELIDLMHSVIPPYRNAPGCGWLMNDTVFAAVRKLKDTTNQYLLQPSFSAGDPITLLGKPVYLDANMPAATTGLKPIVFGDLSRYYVRSAGGLRFDRSDDYAFNADLITFRALWRLDGELVDTTGAVKHLIMA